MKKLIYGGLAIVVIFIIIALVSNKATSDKVADNPYGKDKLSPATIELLSDENYQNITTPQYLEKKLSKSGKEIVYFFHPECQYCRQMTPELMKVVKSENYAISQMNLQEFNELTNQYEINSWPVLAVYEDGKELARIEGYTPEENIKSFLDTVLTSD